MAFTDTERAKIRQVLGWAGRWFQLDTALEEAMTAVAAETETLIKAELTRIAAIETKLDAADTYYPATQVSGIAVAGAQNRALLSADGRRSSGRIAAQLGVEIRADYWSGGQASNYLMHG